jgi:HlyD family secretion protein
VLGLQRSAATIDGDLGATDAEIARLRTSAGETRFQMLQLADTHAHDNTDRLRTAQSELGQVLPQWKAAREQVERSLVRAPVAGTVLGLAVNTVGGVAQPGQKLMDIVPSAGALEVEAQVSLGDANELRPGQAADVRVSGLRGRMLTPLHGQVARVSADSLTDEKSGRSFFTATVRVPRAAIDRLGRDAGIASLKPGTPVDVAIPLVRRTALQYWIGPLTQRLQPALSER